ncbi:RNA/RNP complex-1-interacting phosphatase [Drosophila obscura]|uniref:RNA/RNP complex-1-interacting phosphatase n=1 Tax=Drosophila obscura TaxID=7282 RepID=UPI001BB127C7|nr:RNA/RNP complex-1-interacting phosphatase [Drosophila obscura]
MGRGVPDRWLDYSAIGKRVPGTRFIAFKVPLNQNLNGQVDRELQLGPELLLESVPNLGMIIDLTNTDRYYRPQSFTENDVMHQKLMIPGKQTPSKALAQRFCRYVVDFLEDNVDNDKLIGVHCTHGVNRTGYLICYFMITMLNKSPLEAIESVAAARGHKIERENYLSSLRRLEKLEADVNKESSEEPSRRNWREDAARRQQEFQQQPQYKQQQHQQQYQQQKHQPERRYQQRDNQRAYDSNVDDSRQSSWHNNWSSNRDSNNGYRDHSRGRHQPEDRYRSSDNGWQQRGRQQYQDRSRDRLTHWQRPQHEDRQQTNDNGYHRDFRNKNSEWKSTRNGSGEDPEWNKPHWNGSNHSNNWRQSHYQSRNEHDFRGHNNRYQTRNQPYNYQGRTNRHIHFNRDD